MTKLSELVARLNWLIDAAANEKIKSDVLIEEKDNIKYYNKTGLHEAISALNSASCDAINLATHLHALLMKAEGALSAAENHMGNQKGNVQSYEVYSSVRAVLSKLRAAEIGGNNDK